jgi:hypothetical protein
MKPQERYLTALRGGKPDQVPVSLSIGPSNTRRWLGREDWRAVLEAHEIVGSIPAQDFGLDYFTTDTNPIFQVNWPSGWGETIESRSIPGTKGGMIKTRTITTPTGILTSQERLDLGEYIHGQTLEPLIKSKSDYKVYISYIDQWLDSVEICDPNESASGIEEILSDAGVWVTWNIHSFYQYFWVLRRVEEFLVDFYDDPGLMKEVMDMTWMLNEKYIQIFNASSSPFLICNLSGASTSIISPEFFREWILPELELMTRILEPEKFLGFHLTGKIRNLMPILLEAKPDAILRFESPRFGGDISLKGVKDMYGDQVCIIGGFDPHFYVLGDREDIRLETIRCIEAAAAGGGYILANTDHIPEEAELEDVKFMVDVAREYGHYE